MPGNPYDGHTLTSQLEQVELGRVVERRAFDLHQAVDRHRIRMRRQVGQRLQQAAPNWGVQLTEAGARLLMDGRRLLMEVERHVSEVGGLESGIEGWFGVLVSGHGRWSSLSGRRLTPLCGRKSTGPSRKAHMPGKGASDVRGS